jgi:hypothetical protein
MIEGQALENAIRKTRKFELCSFVIMSKMLGKRNGRFRQGSIAG